MNPLPFTHNNLRTTKNVVANSAAAAIDGVEYWAPGIGVPLKASLGIPRSHDTDFYEEQRGKKVTLPGLVFLTKVYLPAKIYQGSRWSTKEAVAAALGITQTVAVSYGLISGLPDFIKHVTQMPKTEYQMIAREEDAKQHLDLTYIYQDTNL